MAWAKQLSQDSAKVERRDGIRRLDLNGKKLAAREASTRSGNPPGLVEGIKKYIFKKWVRESKEK